MNKLNGKTLELSLVYALAKTGEDQMKGRVNGLCGRLIKAVFVDLERLPKPTNLQCMEMGGFLDSFQEITKWDGENRHLATTASFCLDMLENSEFFFNPKIVTTLNKIVDHFDRAGKIPGPCFWAGSSASKKWAKIVAAT